MAEKETKKKNNNTVTKAVLQENLDSAKDELKEVRSELSETKNALNDAMSVIAEMKKKLEEQPQVTVVQQSEGRRGNSKIKCMSLCYEPVNIATMPHGQGRVFEFREYGQTIYIKYDDMLDVISSYPNTIGSGLIYIADKEFCEEQGIYDDMNQVYTKELLDKIVRLHDDVDVELLSGMSKPLLESTVRKIAELYNANEFYEPNKLARIKKDLGYDIIQIAEDIKIEPIAEDE